MNNVKEVEVANYKEPILPIHRGNPLVEALPFIPDDGEELYNVLRSPIMYKQEQRLLPHGERYEYTNMLSQIFQPWGIHFEIVRRINMAIKGGYTSRNPLSAGYYQDLTKIASSVAGKSGPIKTLIFSNAQAPGFSIIGTSGTGKTTAIKRILSVFFPQKILHEEYHGEPFPHLQLVWMYLSCPTDGGIKGLCTEFFLEFDRLTGSNTLQKYGDTRNSVNRMIAQMSLLVRRHSLGALVIDEIQRLNMAKSGGKERMLDYLAMMMDQLGIPIIVIGTESAMDVLKSSFVTARRLTGSQGNVVMRNLAYGDGDWDILMSGIWPYQWTKEKTPLDESLKRAFHQVTNGNVALTVNLYCWVQQDAIQLGRGGASETITPKLIQSVARSDRFAALRESYSFTDAIMETESKKQKRTKQKMETSSKMSDQIEKPKRKKDDPLDNWEDGTLEETLLAKGLLARSEEENL